MWLDAAKIVLTNLITTLNNKEYAKNIHGIFTGIGSHTEGGGWSCYMEKECYDFTVPNRLAFTEFLKASYPCFETMRELFQKQVWKSWDDVTISECEERMVADVGMFHDPAEGGVYIRAYRIFENRLNLDRLERLGRAVKEASENKLLSGAPKSITQSVRI